MLSRRRLVVVFAALSASIVVVLCLTYYGRQPPIKLAPQYPSPPPHAHPSPPPPSSPSSSSSNATSPPKILLVSAFFPLSKSKHPLSDYEYWLSNFLQRIETPIYFYTPPHVEALIRKSSSNNNRIFINTTFGDAFDIPPLQGLRGAYEEMHAWDRERFRHSPELYAVWNAKPYFLNEALRIVNSLSSSSASSASSGSTNNQNTTSSSPSPSMLETLASTGPYDYAFWVDAGSFRDQHAYKLWPDPERVRQVFREGARVSVSGGGGGDTAPIPMHDELIFFPIAEMPDYWWRWWKESDGPVDLDFSEGSFFGGAPPAISWYTNTFYAQHNKYLLHSPRRHFVGKDQTLINAIIFLNAKRFVGVWSGQPQPRPLSSSSSSSSSAPSPSTSSRLDSGSSDSSDSSDSSSLEPLLTQPLSHLFLPPQSSTSHTPLPTYCGAEWYYYEFFLASPSERREMLKLWTRIRDERVKDKDGGWLGRVVGWWRRGWVFPWVRTSLSSPSSFSSSSPSSSSPSISSMGERVGKEEGGEGKEGEGWVDETVCGVKDVLSLEGVLKAQFGGGWEPRRMAV